jgi:hypothetical protein
MKLFNKLPGFVRTPPGLEREILRRLPRMLVLGTLLLGVPSLVARVFSWSGSEAEIATRMTTVDMFVIGVVTVHWTLVLTVAFAAFIVLVMKGPAYVADAYPLEDAEAPDTPDPPNTPDTPPPPVTNP